MNLELQILALGPRKKITDVHIGHVRAVPGSGKLIGSALEIHFMEGETRPRDPARSPETVAVQPDASYWTSACL